MAKSTSHKVIKWRRNSFGFGRNNYFIASGSPLDLQIYMRQMNAIMEEIMIL